MILVINLLSYVAGVDTLLGVFTSLMWTILDDPPPWINRAGLTGFNYFFPKKDVILPCPSFPLTLLFLPDDISVDDGVLSFGADGSSSENDSHDGSSFVTVVEI